MNKLFKVQSPYTLALQEYFQKLKDLGLFDKYRKDIKFFKKGEQTFVEITLNRELMDVLDLIGLHQRKN